MPVHNFCFFAVEHKDTGVLLGQLDFVGLNMMRPLRYRSKSVVVSPATFGD
ncbi:MAG: hypothetical protein ABF697_05350 [Zymomonas mobilis]|uniref:hypothetical protein n=1 Tax=Zymomonas mobilis TaxID=542 RepID=UPI0039EA464B